MQSQNTAAQVVRSMNAESSQMQFYDPQVQFITLLPFWCHPEHSSIDRVPISDVSCLPSSINTFLAGSINHKCFIVKYTSSGDDDNRSVIAVISLMTLRCKSRNGLSVYSVRVPPFPSPTCAWWTSHIWRSQFMGSLKADEGMGNRGN